MTSPRLLLAPLVLLLACGDNGTGAPTGTDGGSSGATQDATSAASMTTTPGTATTDASGSASATEGGTTTQGSATQATTDPITSGPSSTTMGPATDSDGASTDGSTSDGASTTDASSTTDGGSSTTDASSTTDGGSSSGGSTGLDTTGEPMEEGLWLTMIEDTSSPTRLYKIDLLTGKSTLLCQLNTSDDYNTSTFSRDGLLYAANANTKNLEIINPCDCKRTIVGPTKVDALPGITADQALGLYGMDTTLDNFVSLDTNTGNATVIGPLGLNWGTGGLTWSDVLKDTYAINGTDDKLYTINHKNGKATALIQTNYNFGSVGIEWHPKTGEIYACSNPAELLVVSEKTGEVSVVGPMNLENKMAHCDNLAAPWVPVACVEDK